MDRRTEPLTDFSTEDNRPSKVAAEISQKGTVYQKRVNADKTASGFPLIVGGLPSAKVCNDVALPSSASTSGRRKTTRKRNHDDSGQPFSIQSCVLKAKRKGYTGKMEPLKDMEDLIYQEKQMKDASERSHKEAADNSSFLEKVNELPEVKDYLGMCCTVARLTPSRAVSCKVTTCQTLIDVGIKCWEYKNGEERIVICNKCYISKKPGEYILVKAQKYSPWNNEWIHAEKLKSDFKAIKLQQDGSEGEHTVVCSYCRNAHHVMCVKYEPYNWETAYGKYCKDFRKYFRPSYVCKKCMQILDPNSDLPRMPAVLFNPEDLGVTELTRKMEDEMRQFYYEKTADEETILYVREVSSRKGILEAQPRMKREYENVGKPTQWQYIRRNIMVFQQRPDSEYPIALFNLIVFEYPEISAVNLSYLDSVKLFEPSDIRKQVYQRCVLSYLRQVRHQYQMLYFWVCPPSPGDEYVFYGRPAEVIDQTLAGLPENGLFRWYKEIMETGKNENIVEEFLQAGENCNPYEGNYLDAPYLLDDFWPSKFETILENHEKETNDYAAAQSNRVTNRQRSARAKKAQQNGPPPTINERYLQAVKECNDALFVVHLKNPGDDESNEYFNEAFEEADVLCSYMNNRDNFMVDCRENRFDFSNPRRAEYSTLLMCSKIAQESRTKKCIMCEKTIREGVYCYQCPAQENKVFCSDCSSKHEHKVTLRKFKVPFFEEPENISGTFGVILKQLKEEADFVTNLSYELCAPRFKRRYSSEEFQQLAKVIRLHVAALNSVDEKVHPQTNCRACAAAWLPLIRHKEFCKGEVCTVPSCTFNVPFDNNGVVYRATPTRSMFV